MQYNTLGFNIFLLFKRKKFFQKYLKVFRRKFFDPSNIGCFRKLKTSMDFLNTYSKFKNFINFLLPQKTLSKKKGECS